MSAFNALMFASADQRRSLAKKYAAHLPADIASVVAGLNVLSDAFPTPTDPPVRAPEPLTGTGVQFSVLPRVRVLTALIEPNTLPLARNMTLRRRSQGTTIDADGVYVTKWNTVSDHELAYRDSFEHYLSMHDLVADISRGISLDSWHSPMLLVAVRHQYADGTPAVSGLMAADGTARIWGARMALSADLEAWGVTHEWTDPAARWTLGMADIRKAVAAARTQVAAITVAATHAKTTQAVLGSLPAAVSTGSVEDWANVVVPDPEFTLSELGMHLYQTHSTHTPVEEGPFSDDVADWVKSIDVFAGTNPFDLLGLDAAKAEDREQVAYYTEELQRDVLTVVTNKDETARRVALMAVGVTYDTHVDPFGATADAEAGRDKQFHRWVAPAVSRTRSLHWAAVPGVVRLRHTLATTRTFPVCDLYGVNGDLGSHSLYSPLNDPTSEWFTLTAMRGLTYAILHGHLIATTMKESPAHEAARQALDDEHDALVDAIGEDAAIEKHKDELPPEFDTETLRLAIMGDFDDNTLERLLTTAEGHDVVLHYAAHAAAGTVPKNLFRYYVSGGRQRVEFMATELMVP